MTFKATFLISSLFLLNTSFSQTSYQDSLLQVFDTISSHTDRYNYALEKDWDNNLSLSEIDEWYKLAYQEAAYLGDLDKIITIYTSAAVTNSNHGKYEEAANYIATAKEFSSTNLSDAAKMSINHAEYSYYSDIGEYDIAINILKPMIENYQAKNDSGRVAVYAHNLAICYYNVEKYDSAITLLKEAYAINEARDHYYQFYNISMLANVYTKIGKHELALENYYLSLTDALNNQDYYSIAANQINIAGVLIEMGRNKEAYELLDEAIYISKEKEYNQWLLNALSTYFQAFEKSKKYEQAYNYLKEFMELKNEILNETSINQLSTAQKEIDDKNIKMLEKEKIASQLIIDQQTVENEKKSLMLFFSMGIGLLFIGLLIFIWRGYNIKKKANEVILNQKKLVEAKNEEILQQKNHLQEKNNEILDSITYAKRIQSAILPPNEVIKKHLPQSFVFYKPKDIVAGDFYWMQPFEADSKENNAVLFAVADCTGHGVPGAMVSVVCNNALNRAVREYGLRLPGKILDKTREIVLQEFDKSEDKVNDGMDIAICSLEDNILNYAGANNPLWIIRKGSSEIDEIKPSKQPIGEFHNSTDFETHQIKLSKGDSIYLFSDGYADQFGGDKGKKFKAKTLKDLFLRIQNKPMTEQELILNQEFENWKGELEQIDDICILGVRV